MNVRGRRFETDRSEGKILGVCAGIANQIGIDATIVRISVVVLALAVSVPWMVVAYLVAAYFGRPTRRAAHLPKRMPAREESQERMRSLDLRMQAIETYVTSSNSRLAREIEELR